MSHVIAIVRKLIRQGDGATMIEYALMLALISLICIGAVSVVGRETLPFYGPVTQSL